MRPLPPLAGLEAFDAVARHLSFSSAGRELHITQAAVSHRIRSLETFLGVQLFSRTSRQITMTQAGIVLFAGTSQAFQRVRASLGELELLANPGRITVSCSPSFAIRWLVPHLNDLRQFAPDLELRIAAEDALVRPGLNFIDACIRFGAGGYQGVDSEQLTEEAVGPVCSPDYLKRKKLVTPSGLAKCTLLHDDVLVDHPDHVGWHDWLEAAGATGINPARGTRFSHAHMALDAAIAGQGVALARGSLVRQNLAVGALVEPFDFHVPSGLNYWLVTPKGTPSHTVSMFREWLVVRLQGDHSDVNG